MLIILLIIINVLLLFLLIDLLLIIQLKYIKKINIYKTMYDGGYFI